MYNEGFFYNAIKRDIAMVRGDTMAFAFQVFSLFLTHKNRFPSSNYLR